MDLYLPIAGLSVNILVIIGLGGLVGILSGMFGVGGGFLTTPLMIFYGIPPAVAVASSAPQITGASVSGVLAHGTRGGVDYQMGGVLVAGGAIGSLLGGFLFRLLQDIGQIDTVVNVMYVVMLGGIGIVMAKDAIGSLQAQWRGIAPPASGRRHHPLIAMMPFRWRFYRSGLYISPLAPLLLGLATFWSMSGQRQTTVPLSPPPAQVAETAPAPVAEPVPPPPSAMAMQAQPAPMLVVPVNQATPMSSPVMVFDTSSVRALPAPSGASAPTPGNAPKTAAGQGLSDNEGFAARLGDAGVETASATRLVDPANTITQGTLIAAILETAIDSDLPGYVRAVVSHDFRSFDGSRILIPRSSRLIGQYKSGLAAGQTRAYVFWTRLIRPDGVSVALASPATDHAGRSGLGGEVDGHFGKRFGSAILLSAVGGLGAIASGGASLIVSGGQSAASVAAQRDAQIPPTIRVRQGQPIRIFTARDLDFSTVAEEPAP